MSIATSLHALDLATDPMRSHWEVLLTTGKRLSENQLVFDFRRGGYRRIDWALDLNTTGDLNKIKELWLVTPSGDTTIHQNGVERPIMFKFPLSESGTAFQFKHGTMDALGGIGRNVEAQIIGHITNKEEGDCECWIWDRVVGLIEYKSNVNTFGMWRPDSGLPPLGKLSESVIGLRL